MLFTDTAGIILIILGAWFLFQSYRLTLKTYERGLVMDSTFKKRRRNKIIIGIIFAAAGILFLLSDSLVLKIFGALWPPFFYFKILSPS